MNLFKLIWNDLKEGVLKNRRFLVVPVLCIFECLAADINLNYAVQTSGTTTSRTFFDVFSEIFHGADPLSKVSSWDIPYFWITIFVGMLLMSFDYMQNDLTHFGMQILTRVKKRKTWWFSKCMYSTIAALFYYVVFLAVIALFCVLSGYDVSLHSTQEIMNILNSSGIYMYNQASQLSTQTILLELLSPFVVLITINMLQMVLSLVIKPIYSMIVVIGVVLLGIFWDFLPAFSRSAMVMMSDIYYSDGYPMKKGLLVCAGVIVVSVIVGKIIFDRFDIIPERDS